MRPAAQCFGMPCGLTNIFIFRLLVASVLVASPAGMRKRVSMEAGLLLHLPGAQFSPRRTVHTSAKFVGPAVHLLSDPVEFAGNHSVHISGRPAGMEVLLKYGRTKGRKVSRGSSRRQEPCKRGGDGERIGCVATCQCLWYQQCYKKTVNGVDVGACDWSLFAQVCWSALLVTCLAAVTLFFRGWLLWTTDLEEEQAALERLRHCGQFNISVKMKSHEDQGRKKRLSLPNRKLSLGVRLDDRDGMIGLRLGVDDRDGVQVSS